MPDKEESKDRKRMIVEEVELSKKEEVKPDILPEGIKVSSNDIISDDNAKPIEMPVEMPVAVETKKPKSPIFWILIPGVFLLGAILGGIVFYQKGVNKEETIAPSPSPTTGVTIVTPAPSTTPLTSVDLAKFSISVLNGSGTAGEATKVKDLLVTAGFKVGSTGNAATYDFTKTIIKAKTTVDATFITQLSTTLGKTYLVDTVQTLASSSADIIQVVVGTSKASK